MCSSNLMIAGHDIHSSGTFKRRVHPRVIRVYSRSPKVGNPVASILKSNVKGIPALFGLNPVSNFMGFTVLPGRCLAYEQ